MLFNIYNSCSGLNCSGLFGDRPAEPETTLLYLDWKLSFVTITLLAPEESACSTGVDLIAIMGLLEEGKLDICLRAFYWGDSKYKVFAKVSV